MTRLTFVILTAALATTAIPAFAAERGQVLDRIEDRIDRREDRIDRQVDNGPLDRLEDRIDRRESRRDRRGIEGARIVDRHERRSWRRIWRARNDD